MLGGLTALPADIVALLRDLPTLVGHLERITRNTEAMPQMLDALEAVGEDTRVLPGMDARMAAIESAMPTLVEVQQHLALLPETMESLGTGIVQTSALLERLLGSLDRLDENVNALRGAIEPLGRIADRLPGSGSRR